MHIILNTYNNEQRDIRNVKTFSFDGETGLLRYTTFSKPLETNTMNYVKNIKVGGD